MSLWEGVGGGWGGHNCECVWVQLIVREDGVDCLSVRVDGRELEEPKFLWCHPKLTLFLAPAIRSVVPLMALGYQATTDRTGVCRSELLLLE